MKVCKEENCKNSQFGGGYCKYHQYRRMMRGADKYVSKAQQRAFKTLSPQKHTKVPKQSKKRLKEDKTYKQVKDELREELIAEGKWNCFFCDKPMKGERGFHHTKGRDGTNFTDRKYLKPAHNQCHVWDYHQAEVEELLNQLWYPGFLERLKELDESLWRKELKKQEKSVKLNPRIEFDEELF